MIKQFAREHLVMGARWQWVGYPRDDEHTVTLLTAFKSEGGKWTYQPTLELETRNDESQEERFDAFVDTFLRQSKENG